MTGTTGNSETAPTRLTRSQAQLSQVAMAGNDSGGEAATQADGNGRPASSQALLGHGASTGVRNVANVAPAHYSGAEANTVGTIHDAMDPNDPHIRLLIQQLRSGQSQIQ